MAPAPRTRCCEPLHERSLADPPRGQQEHVIPVKEVPELLLLASPVEEVIPEHGGAGEVPNHGSPWNLVGSIYGIVALQDRCTTDSSYSWLGRLSSAEWRDLPRLPTHASSRACSWYLDSSLPEARLTATTYDRPGSPPTRRASGYGSVWDGRGWWASWFRLFRNSRLSDCT